MEELPRQCNYQALGAARIREIKSIVAKLESCEHGGRAFQKLPRHMQRRAVSSNPRRLPRYLREKHMREGGGNTKPTHRPRRKYRRRPSNLLQEYNRRQNEYVWLETHIWHSKRFHMKRQWGYALPDSPTCRGHRASLRAVTTGCFLQDVSYLCCIELDGVKSTILQSLSRAMQPESVAILTSPQVATGKQWMSSVFFKAGREPYGALGEVDVLFHPSQRNTEDEEDRVKLWLWTHPSAHTTIVETLAEIFHLDKVPSSSNDCIPELSEKAGGDQKELEDKEGDIEVEECKKETPLDDACKKESEAVPGEESQITPNKKKNHKKAKDINAEKLQTRNVPFERTPKYVSSDGNTSMTLLKDTLNRFRLIGPRSYSVLSSAIHPANVILKEEEGVKECDEPKRPWWKDYFSEEGRLQSHQRQVASWKQLALCPHPPDKVVLPLTVRDPRVTLPTKKVPMEDEDADNLRRADLPEWPVESAIYCSDLRDQVTFTKEPDAVLNQRRSQFLVPGSHLPETPQESRLPLLLLSQPPRSAALGSGWEVVIPSGWGMSVFLPLVFNGGVVNGQHEAENLHLEALTSLPPHLMPDTPAGDLYSTFLAAERHKEFFKRPPACRHNYIKLGVQFPFTQPWRKLVQEWQPGISDCFMLRNSRLIKCLSNLIKDVKMISDKVDELDKVTDDSSIKSTDTKPVQKRIPTDHFNSNSNVATTNDTNSTGKRKADHDTTSTETKKTKHQHSEETIDIDNLKRNVSEEGDGAQELALVSPACLVMVQLVLAHKGTLEPCAMVCLPRDEDLFPQTDVLKVKEQGDALEEPLHEDHNHDRRVKMKEERTKIMAKIKRMRCKARKKVAKEMDFVSVAQSRKSVKAATTEALKKVEKENEVILKKQSSYKEEMECAWLMSASEPLQCCARPIMGYTTHATFSYTHGKAAGIGWVGLKPLLRLLDQCREGRGQQSSLLDALWKGKCSSSLPVLVRNPSTLQYRWAQLSIVKSPYLDA